MWNIRPDRLVQFLSVVGLLAAGISHAATFADLVLTHGRIITMDPKDRIVEALAVNDGKIVQVGSNDVIQKLVGSGTRVIDLAGRAVTPGLIDAHAHVLDTGLTDLFELKLSDTQSIQGILDPHGRLLGAEGLCSQGESIRRSRCREIEFQRNVDLHGQQMHRDHF